MTAAHEPPGGPGSGEWLESRFADADRLMTPPGQPPMDHLTSRGRRRRARRRAAWSGGLASAAAAVVALVVALVPAGGGGSTTRVATSPSTPAPRSVTHAPRSVTSTPRAVTPAPTTSSTAACRSGELAVTEKAQAPGAYVSGALGHSAVTVEFRNTGSRTCTLAGYPGVAGLDPAGTQVVQAGRSATGYMGGLSGQGAVPPTVTLVPGGYASAVVEGLDARPDGSAAPCPSLAAMLVTAPNTRHAVRVPAAPADCNGLQVHPVVAGTSGRQSRSTAPPATVPATAGRPAPACTYMQLHVGEKKQPSGGYLEYGLGHSAVVILFTDTGHHACSLHGYPGAAGVDPAGAQSTQAARTPSGYMGGLAVGERSMPVVTLQPGATASAVVEGTDNPAGTATTCPPLGALVVTAPNTRTSVRLPAAPGDCSGLEVHPVVAGTAGSVHR